MDKWAPTSCSLFVGLSELFFFGFVSASHRLQPLWTQKFCFSVLPSHFADLRLPFYIQYRIPISFPQIILLYFHYSLSLSYPHNCTLQSHDLWFLNATLSLLMAPLERVYLWQFHCQIPKRLTLCDWDLGIQRGSFPIITTCGSSIWGRVLPRAYHAFTICVCCVDIGCHFE